jgi:hypothetical protein
MAQSKNSKKGSKVTQVIYERKERPKKQEILIEITNEIFNELKQNADLSMYHDMPIIDTISYHGKKYLKVSRIKDE